MTKILCVEDNTLDFVQAKRELLCAFPNAKVEQLTTERDFRRWLGDVSVPLPDLIILDIMLPWTDASPEIEPPPEDVERSGRDDAGLRCYELLRAHPSRSHIPVILLTGRERELVACPEGVRLLAKLDRKSLGELARSLMVPGHH
jgi:CheY-like chemotaxis protein